MRWHSRERVLKDCDGRLLALGADLQPTSIAFVHKAVHRGEMANISRKVTDQTPTEVSPSSHPSLPSAKNQVQLLPLVSCSFSAGLCCWPAFSYCLNLSRSKPARRP